jgi:uncharacterized protein (TIGR03118 family)
MKGTTMQNESCRFKKLLIAAVAAALTATPLVLKAQNSPAARSKSNPTNPGYTEVDLVSDTGAATAHTDPRLINAWGLGVSSSTIWVSDNGTGMVTTYSAAGNPSKTAVHVPAPGGGAGTPTGLVLNNTGQFVLTTGSKTGPATFLAATEDGTIVAWNPAAGSNAVIVIDRSGLGANYKGITIASDSNNVPHIYAANFRSDYIDEFDTNFDFVQSFTDPEIPGSGFAPFNVRTFRGRLFVTLARKATESSPDDLPGPGNGFLDIFDTDGTFLRDFADNGPLNSPWGMAIAPKNFGKFSHALLVGNFGDGKINAFDLLTGKHLGNLTRDDGNDLVIDGLWGLSFEKEETLFQESNFSAQRLYFTAGPNSEADGLLGVIRPVSPNFPPAQ